MGGGGKQRNPMAASVPHLSFTVRPYTLNCREERTPEGVNQGDWGEGDTLSQGHSEQAIATRLPSPL